MAIFPATAAYDMTSMTTSYTWVVCRGIGPCPTPVSSPDIGQLRIDITSLDACGGLAAHPISAGTTEPYQTSDPACFGALNSSVVKWPIPTDNNTCQPLVLVLGGELGTGTVPAGTITGMGCPLLPVGGPACVD